MNIKKEGRNPVPSPKKVHFLARVWAEQGKDRQWRLTPVQQPLYLGVFAARFDHLPDLVGFESLMDQTLAVDAKVGASNPTAIAWYVAPAANARVTVTV